MSDEKAEARGGPDGEGWLERLLHRMRLKPRESIRDDLEEVLSEAGAAADFSPQERAMLKNVLALDTVRVSDVMVPRADILAVADDISLAELLATFRTAGHSRLPVYVETLDDPRGMIHIRDFVEFIAAGAEKGNGSTFGNIDLSSTLAAAQILRPVLFVPRSMPALDLLVRMQASRTHMALVIDEYGGTDGLVSMEDLVETIVGEIEDEHDEAAEAIVVEPNGVLLAAARAGLDEVSAALGVDLASDEAAEEIDTIGGLIVTLAGRVPARGEIVTGPSDLEFEVLDADPRRLKRVRIRRTALGAPDPGPTGPAEAGTLSTVPVSPDAA